MFFKEIETKRLILKNIGKEDVEFILKQFSNNEVTRYLYDEEPFTSLSEAEVLIDCYTQEEPRSQHRWILVKKDTGEKIGTCGFHCWNRETGNCEIGYDLYPDYWRQGYMTEAVTAILKFAVEEMKITRIEAHVYVDNIASKKIVEHHGFIASKDTYMEVFRGKEYLHNIYEKTYEMTL